MTKLTDRLAEIERQQGFFSTWLPLIKAAGYDFTDGDPLSFYDAVFLGGQIMHALYRQAWDMKPEGDTIVDFMPIYIGILEAMTDDEREALRTKLDFVATRYLHGGPALG
jgi:hypothetical protein